MISDMQLPNLNLPPYEFRFRKSAGKTNIYDPVRKKYLVLTPEEWVRQNFVQFLIREKGYPKNLLHIEATLTVYGKSLRSDIIVYNRDMKPLVLVECKAPNIAITEETFYQAATYNIQTGAPYLILTNGLEHYCLQIPPTPAAPSFLPEIPPFSEL